MDSLELRLRQMCDELSNMAMIYTQRRDYKRANDCLNAAIKLYETITGGAESAQ